MSRIAIVDMLFNWPPDGGARTDIKEIATRLARDHTVRLFCPDYQQFFPRGRISGLAGDIDIVTIPFNFYTFNHHVIGQRFRRAVAEFGPDHVVIADTWFMKPHLARALAEYRPLLRFYAYESLCLNRGSLWRRGRVCQVDYVGLPWHKTFRCVACAMWGQKFRADTQHGQEFWGALAFLPSYRRRAEGMLRGAGGLIVSNEFIADNVRRFNPNVWIVPGGVDPQRFTATPRQGGGPARVAMVGRAYDPIKGFDVLSRAAAQLYETRRDFKLVVTAAQDEPYLRKPYIEIGGWFTQETLPEFYRRVDICVVPSVWTEPFGLVALEGMSAGKPVIASRAGGLSQIVREGETGFTVPPGDAAALANRIAYLLDHPEVGQRLGRAGRALVEREYTWDAVYRRFYQPLFAGVSGGSPGLPSAARGTLP